MVGRTKTDKSKPPVLRALAGVSFETGTDKRERERDRLRILKRRTERHQSMATGQEMGERK